MRDNTRRTPPSCNAASIFPTEVSSTTLVVSTRVFPAMFPPTIKTAPTSAIARPNPSKTALTIPLRAQYISRRTRFDFFTFMTRKTSRLSSETRSKAPHATPRISGKISNVCAKIIPSIVNNQLRSASTPSFDKAR